MSEFRINWSTQGGLFSIAELDCLERLRPPAVASRRRRTAPFRSCVDADVVSAGSGSILAIGCINVMSLQLARAVEQSAELSVQLALGAPRSRLVRRMLRRARTDPIHALREL